MGVEAHRSVLTRLTRMMLVVVEGICEGIPAGTVTLAIYAGICSENSVAGDCWFGWNSYPQILVSESYVEREIIV